MGTPRRTWYVDASRGFSSARSGRSSSRGFLTIQAAVNAASAGDTIEIANAAEGYDEQVTIARAKHGLSLVGVGGRGAVYIEPSAANPVALTVHADDVSITNLGCGGDGTGGGLVVTGARFRAQASKIEGGANALTATLGTVAQITANTRGKGADVLFEDCEFCWAPVGVLLAASDFGAVTQAKFRRCVFHNLPTASIEESGASAAVHYRNLLMDGCTFDGDEDGVMPAKFVSLNDDNTNTGLVTGCRFPVAVDSGKNLVSTKLLWVANFHPAGLSAAQPS